MNHRWSRKKDTMNILGEGPASIQHETSVHSSKRAKQHNMGKAQRHTIPGREAPHGRKEKPNRKTRSSLPVPRKYKRPPQETRLTLRSQQHAGGAAEDPCRSPAGWWEGGQSSPRGGGVQVSVSARHAPCDLGVSPLGRCPRETSRVRRIFTLKL